MSGSVDVRRGADRAVTTHPGIETRHAFSFGAHHEPGNTHHGLLLAHNEDRIDPGAGYDTHAHRDTEIVTWVLTGALAHADSEGHAGELRPGSVQRVSAGRGIEHSERHAATGPGAGAEGLHLVQMWLLPDSPGAAPDHEQRDLSAALAGGDLVTVASGMARDDDGPGVRLGVASAALHVARPAAGRALELPDAEYLHVHVARGTATLSAGDAPVALAAGDAARLRAAGRPALTATTDAEVLVWEMHEGLGD
ncbi:pirin family protein [Actinomycetospora endophytica]|uniref:Pirin family protein n=1 Tax=Actinomycetospora endophytica TaxID=2291215 RepID=A0ABS8P1U1_9PSEU|nr:pirin family protein [Actinomycetospora endophytica]MCD2192212.1 pirin family protein [Actinomycetospora endophytica]